MRWGHSRLTFGSFFLKLQLYIQETGDAKIMTHFIFFSKKRFFITVFLGSMLSTGFVGAQPDALPYQGRKILFVDSYHVGYAWSDGITSGIKSVLDGTGIELRIERMDTKRNKEETFKKQVALKVKTVIEEFKPDVVIASDDNASKYLVMPYYKDASIPFVFCGVNWEVEEYGYPYKNVTGMIEVDLVEEMISQLRKHAKGDRIALIAGDTLTQKKITRYLNEHIFDGNLKVYLVSTFAEFKEVFLKTQNEVDMLYLRNNAGISGWDDDAAEVFITENIRIPIGSSHPWMQHYALCSILTVPEEQGILRFQVYPVSIRCFLLCRHAVLKQQRYLFF